MSVVKQSLIPNAGNGVFTTKKYKKGEYICYYDCEERSISSLSDFIYSININNKTYIGYNKSITNNGIGQFINDYCMFELIHELDDDENGIFKLSDDKIINKINNYTNLSISNQNVSFGSNQCGNILEMYATKDIDENEELYYSYGVEYWLSFIRLTSDEPLTKLFCVLKLSLIRITNDCVFFDNLEVSPELIFEFLKMLPNGNIIKYFKIEHKLNIDKLKYLINYLQ
jgi:hypothetical protein